MRRNYQKNSQKVIAGKRLNKFEYIYLQDDIKFDDNPAKLNSKLIKFFSN